MIPDSSYFIKIKVNKYLTLYDYYTFDGNYILTKRKYFYQREKDELDPKSPKPRPDQVFYSTNSKEIIFMDKNDNYIYKVLANEFRWNNVLQYYNTSLIFDELQSILENLKDDPVKYPA